MTPREILASHSAGDLFGGLPANRVGDAERRYMAEILDSGFSNKGESAGMLRRLE